MSHQKGRQSLINSLTLGTWPGPMGRESLSSATRNGPLPTFKIPQSAAEMTHLSTEKGIHQPPVYLGSTLSRCSALEPTINRKTDKTLSLDT